MSWMGRIFQFLANEFVVAKLANSPWFQRFAVNTAKKMAEGQKVLETVTDDIVKKGSKASQELAKKGGEFQKGIVKDFQSELKKFQDGTKKK